MTKRKGFGAWLRSLLWRRTPAPVFISRYDVLGHPSGCKECEGTSLVPYREGADLNEAPIYRVLWYLMEARQQTDDGYHFLPCPDCQPDDPLMRLARRFMGARSAPQPPTGDAAP